MKYLSHGIVALMLLMCSSCTQTIYTSQQNMSRFNNKQDIVNEFGLPTQKRTGEGIEEWIYDYGTVSTRTGFGNSNTNASVYGNGNTAYGSATTNSAFVTRFDTYSKYVKFTFNESTGKLTNWQSQGVNLSVKKKSPGKTVLLVLGVIGFLVLCGVAGAASASSDSGF